MRQLALITGASDGIGAELARIMAQAGHDLALTARRGDRLDALADEIAATGRPRPLVIVSDLSQADGVDALVEWLAEAGARVDILVNNAGFGLHGAAHDLDRPAQIEMIDLNIRALTDLTLRLLPQLVAARGRILQVASTAAFLPGPNMAVYYATKAYVLSFSEALAQELKAKGVRVSALCPGPTSTGFQARAGLDAALFDMLRPASARDVAQAGYDGMMAGQRVIVPGLMNKASRCLRGSRPARSCCRSSKGCRKAARAKDCASCTPSPQRQALHSRVVACILKHMLDRVASQDSPKRILMVLHQEASTPGRIGYLLKAAGYELDIRRPRFGDPLPATLRDHSGAMVFGGPMSANDGDDYIRREIDWIGVPLSENKPFLGLCLGAQMLARHLGKRVYRHPQGRVEIGYHPIDPTEDGRRLCNAPFPTRVYHWHREGFDLPCGADLLARGEHFEVQACRYGDSAYGLQFHPEVTYAMMRRWTIRAMERATEEPGAHPRHAHLEGWHMHDAPVAHWLKAFLAHWLSGGGARVDLSAPQSVMISAQ